MPQAFKECLTLCVSDQYIKSYEALDLFLLIENM